jgi:hypothetical protein
VSYRAILGPERMRRRHGLTGMFSVRFDQFAPAMFTREDGHQMRMPDLAIPFEAVVAGVRRQSFAALPSRFRHQELAALRLRSIPHLPIGVGPQVAARMWQVAALIDSRIVKPIIIGGDDLTRDFDVVDAASFSSAIPGVLHHETNDPRMHPFLDALCDDKDVGALVDGGAASNVPVELAWKRSRDGKLGTRNACYLAFDCFHPQWDPRHLWLVRSPRRSRCADGAQRALRRPPRPLRADAVAREPGALRREYRPGLLAGAQKRRSGDSGDVRAAGADVVGR